MSEDWAQPVRRVFSASELGALAAEDAAAGGWLLGVARGGLDRLRGALPRLRPIGAPRAIAAWAMLAPAVVALAAFAVYPALYALALSFTKSTLGQPFKQWIGVANYAWQLSPEAEFRLSLARAAGFSFAAAAIELVLGVHLATLASAVRRQRRLVRTTLLLPLMTPPVLVGTAWKLLLAPSGGLVDGKLTAWGLIDAPISFLGEQPWATISILVADIWQWTPFVAILAFAALQQTPTNRSKRRAWTARAIAPSSGTSSCRSRRRRCWRSFCCA